VKREEALMISNVTKRALERAAELVLRASRGEDVAYALKWARNHITLAEAVVRAGR